MHAIESKPIATVDQGRVAARNRLWFLLAESYRYPDAVFLRQARNGDLRRAFDQLFPELPYAFSWAGKEAAHLDLVKVASETAIQVEYIRLFESGPGNPPFPLLEGLYRDERKTVFRELILFYNHFGLSYAEGSLADRPDHVCYELEFLHYLSFKELLALQDGKETEPYRRAQRDFLARHFLTWVPELRKKMRQLDRYPPETRPESLSVFRFYLALVSLTERLGNADYDYLQQKLADEEAGP